jgi:hypothetical protein
LAALNDLRLPIYSIDVKKFVFEGVPFFFSFQKKIWGPLQLGISLFQHKNNAYEVNYAQHNCYVFQQGMYNTLFLGGIRTRVFCP